MLFPGSCPLAAGLTSTKADIAGRHPFFLMEHRAALKDVARVGLEEILGLRAGEEVLIVTDFGEDAYRMARLLFEKAGAMGGRQSIFVQARKTTFEDADRMVLEAIRACPRHNDHHVFHDVG
jgi:hypothetical protein